MCGTLSNGSFEFASTNGDPDELTKNKLIADVFKHHLTTVKSLLDAHEHEVMDLGLGPYGQSLERQNL